MRVDALNQVSRLYKASKPKKVEKTTDIQNKDQLEMSSFAQDYQVAKKAVAEAADVREEKVAELEKKIASGTYNVSAQEIADKMVNRFFGMM